MSSKRSSSTSTDNCAASGCRVRSAAKVMKGELRFPRSSFLLDIWGNEVPASGIGAAAGDPDGVCVPVPETLGVVTWTRASDGAAPGEHERSGRHALLRRPAAHVLARVIDRYEAQGWTPVVACELEFHLIDRDLDHGRPVPPRSPATGRRLSDRNVYGVAELEEFEPVFVDMARTLRGARHPRGIPRFRSTASGNTRSTCDTCRMACWRPITAFS